ncbi:DUF3077 domain-containing protein [Pseudomonas entomophila]|uniref:DUF3077 domain-containing protein n=1 Tax=Pseudomonas entomophila TaxID=312306 RepID=UPI003EB8B940
MDNLTLTCSTAGEEDFLDLFRVQRGVPYDRVFEELSVLLGCIRDLTYKAEVEKDLPSLTSVRYLSSFAKALINDIELARHRSG